jgi:SPASM domain peptide maturase of grasp-with-spasm system
MKSNIPFKLFANCVLVKGANRSTICDLQRNDVRVIPNDLHDLLAENEGKTIDEIKKQYGNEFDEVIDEYFQFLYDNEFIFFSKQVDIFPKLSMEWTDSTIINNCIIDIDENSNYDILNVLQQLNDLQCRHLEIRNFKSARIKVIDNVLKFLKETESSIQSVEILLPFFNDIETWIASTKETYVRVHFVRVFKSPFNKNIAPNGDHKLHAMFTKQYYQNELCCGKINQSFFSANMMAFTESVNFNSCLNKKLSIDRNGNIKNCPSMQNGFGSVTSTKLKSVVVKKDFTKVWNISKDKISICKDCEFRHICTDCRAYLESPNDHLSKPLKCGYNPYTNEWSDWSKNPLKREAISFYNLQAVTEKP